MATWIGHLRIAAKLLAELPDLDETAFTIGNLAPDSGKPNADWSEFDPPKEVSHFQRPGEGEDKIHDLEFYRGYLHDLKPDDDLARYSFTLGYFFHLLSDNLWTRRIGRTSRQEFAAGYAEHGGGFIWEIKKDWYGLDFKYLRDHPNSLFWRVLLPAPNPPLYLPFLTREGLDHSLNHIRTWYSTPDPERVLDRAYPYLNEATMSRYVDDTAASILNVHYALAGKPDLSGMNTAVALLDPAELEPYAPPLGDQ